jgi:2TM domain
MLLAASIKWTSGWGIGLVVHGLNVFEVINFLGPNWQGKQIEKRLGWPL